jgi:hypothetical protein
MLLLVWAVVDRSVCSCMFCVCDVMESAAVLTPCTEVPHASCHAQRSVCHCHSVARKGVVRKPGRPATLEKCMRLHASTRTVLTLASSLDEGIMHAFAFCMSQVLQRERHGAMGT